MKGELETKKYQSFAHKTLKSAPTRKYNSLEGLLDFVGATNQTEGMKMLFGIHFIGTSKLKIRITNVCTLTHIG